MCYGHFILQHFLNGMLYFHPRKTTGTDFIATKTPHEEQKCLKMNGFLT